MEATPTVVLAMWAAGLAAGGALVVWWRVVGRGYVWLTGGVVAMVGLALALTSGNPLAWIGMILGLGAVVTAGRSQVAAGLLLAGAVLLTIPGLDDSPAVPLITGAVFLGGVTTEMMLGHWFLVDPKLPRWSLNRLAVVGGIGLALDVGYLLTQGLISGAGDDAILGWAYGALGVMTALLIVGVIFSLKEPSYTGVMAATGLSYLAVLTAFGVAVVGRMLVA
jgi:hypothetical protein